MHYLQFALAARHLSQAGSVFPLKQLTQEQVAQVQQQIQTSNQFQNNLQVCSTLGICCKLYIEYVTDQQGCQYQAAQPHKHMEKRSMIADYLEAEYERFERKL